MDVLVRLKTDHITYYKGSKHFKRKGIRFYLYILIVKLKGLDYKVIEWKSIIHMNN